MLFSGGNNTAHFREQKHWGLNGKISFWAHNSRKYKTSVQIWRSACTRQVLLICQYRIVNEPAASMEG